jgi:hypothetical protein
MSTSTRLHRSTAYVKAITERGGAWKPDPITKQFRFIVRMAYACNLKQVPYDLAWSIQDHRMSARITATGPIPTPKPLPKPPKVKLVPDWKPSIWDGEYRLDAYQDANRNRKCPGFVIEHSCGLSLVHRSESGELGYRVRRKRGHSPELASDSHCVWLGFRPVAQLQAGHECTLARGILCRGLDSGCEHAEE